MTRRMLPVASFARAPPGAPPARHGALHIVGREAELEVVWISVDHPPGQVKLLQLEQRMSGWPFARNVHAPELAADAPGPQAREIGVAAIWGGSRNVVRAEITRRGLRGPDLPGQVVVAVDQRVTGKQLPRSCQEVGDRRSIHESAADWPLRKPPC